MEISIVESLTFLGEIYVCSYVPVGDARLPIFAERVETIADELKGKMKQFKANHTLKACQCIFYFTYCGLVVLTAIFHSVEEMGILTLRKWRDLKHTTSPEMGPTRKASFDKTTWSII